MAGRLVIGARGWDHPQWAGSFFPDDLPEDWRLTYYSNEFSGVLVPVSLWRVADAKSVRAWKEAVAEEFLFYLEFGTAEDYRHVERTRQSLHPHFGGLVPPGPNIMHANEPWDLRKLGQRLTQLAGETGGAAEFAPGFFLAGYPPDIARLREVRLLTDLLML